MTQKRAGCAALAAVIAVSSVGCSSMESKFIEQCEKGQAAQKIVSQQMGTDEGINQSLTEEERKSGMAEAIAAATTPNCKELVEKYGTECKQQVYTIDEPLKQQLYGSCIASAHGKAVMALVDKKREEMLAKRQAAEVQANSAAWSKVVVALGGIRERISRSGFSTDGGLSSSDAITALQEVRGLLPSDQAAKATNFDALISAIGAENRDEAIRQIDTITAKDSRRAAEAQ